jgi:hypothetical protein
MRSARLIAIVVFALFVGFGAAQELIVGGIRGGATVPLVVGLVGLVVDLICIATAVLLWRGSPLGTRAAPIAGALAILFHAIIWLPPIRIAGTLAGILGVALGILLVYEGTRGATPKANLSYERS